MSSKSGTAKKMLGFVTLACVCMALTGHAAGGEEEHEARSLRLAKSILQRENFPYIASQGRGELDALMKQALSDQPDLAYEVMDLLIYRPISLTQADPARALAFLQAWIKQAEAGPISDVEEFQIAEARKELRLLEQAVSLGPFDAGAFLEKHGINESDWADKPYGLWQLTEAYSSGAFGEPDPTTLFQLAVRGAEVPFEWQTMIQFLYPKLEKGEALTFDLCDYVSSGFGVRFCEHRWDDRMEAEMNQILDDAKSQLPSGKEEAIDDLFLLASEYFWSKAEHEEGHGGAPVWRMRHMEDSVRGRRWSFLEQLKLATTGAAPNRPGLEEQDLMLDYLVREMIRDLDIYGGGKEYDITAEGVRDAQARFVKFRDHFGKVITETSGKERAQEWMLWLTDERIRDIRSTTSAIRGGGFLK